jgi:hypothetical protein
MIQESSERPLRLFGSQFVSFEFFNTSSLAAGVPIKPIKQIRSQAVDLKPTAFSAPFTLRTNAMRNTVNSLSSVHALPVAQWGFKSE